MSWKHRGSRHERGYDRIWEKTRKRILERDEYLCQICLKTGRYTTANEVDHINPKAQGGSEYDENLQSLCHDCHKHKTAMDNGCYQGCDVNGMPLDPDSHWNTGSAITGRGGEKK